MKVNVDRDTLTDAVGFVARSLPARPPAAVLGGITLTASEHGLTLAAFDYETSALAQLGATITDDGAALISGHLLADIAKNLPKTPDVDLALDGTRLRIGCGHARFSLPTMPLEDYPQLPDMPPQVGEIDTELFGDAIPQVAIAAAAESDAIPVLTGIELTPTAGELMLAATNRFRLARRDLTWTPTSEDAGGGSADTTEGMSLVGVQPACSPPPPRTSTTPGPSVCTSPATAHCSGSPAPAGKSPCGYSPASSPPGAS
jgi:DNA polymerase-3 subunit beta